MPKLNIPDILSGYLSAEKLNTAFQNIEDALENTLSRDGTGPNQMQAPLDMNGYAIINSGTIGGDGVVTQTIMENFVAGQASGVVVQKIERQTATAGQSVIDLQGFQYKLGANNLALYLDGIRMFTPTNYTEISPTRLELTGPLLGGEKITLVLNEFLGTVTNPPHNHQWSELTGVPVFATRWPSYTEVTGKPATFTPSSHVHSTADITSGTGLADARRGVYVQSTQPTAGRVGEIWMF